MTNNTINIKNNTDNISAQQTQPNPSSKDNMTPAKQPKRSNSKMDHIRNSVKSYKATANLYGTGTNLTRKNALVPGSNDSPMPVPQEKNMGAQQQRPATDKAKHSANDYIIYNPTGDIKDMTIRRAPSRKQTSSVQDITVQRTDSFNSTSTTSSADTQPTSNKSLNK